MLNARFKKNYLDCASRRTTIQTSTNKTIHPNSCFVIIYNLFSDNYFFFVTNFCGCMLIFLLPTAGIKYESIKHAKSQSGDTKPTQSEKKNDSVTRKFV